MSWQDWVGSAAGGLGLGETSGYRSPAHNRAIGGAAGSYHTRGTPDAPGAIDIGGPAEKLRQLFDEIKQAFQGRINELYLNLPGGGSEAIRHNQPYAGNPEAGRPQHLHIAIGGPPLTGAMGGLSTVPAPGVSTIPTPDAPAVPVDSDQCLRKLCPPDFKGMVNSALHRKVEPQTNCICWSDVIIYGAGVVLIVGGSWLIFKEAK